MGQASSAAARVGKRSNSNSCISIGESSGSIGPISVATKGSSSSSSIGSKKSQRSAAVTLQRRKQRRIKKQQEEESMVEFLPYPYERPDSKAMEPNNTLERIALQVLRMYADQSLRLIEDHFTFGAVLQFPGIAFDLVGFMELHRQMINVFPDFHMEYKLVGETSPGVVTTIVQACGTHSGGDYCTPTCPEPLPPQNARCKNDPEYYTFTFQGGKIKHLSSFPVSSETRYHGPDGFYQQIVEHNSKRQERRRQQMKSQQKCQRSVRSFSSANTMERLMGDIDAPETKS